MEEAAWFHGWDGMYLILHPRQLVTWSMSTLAVVVNSFTEVGIEVMRSIEMHPIVLMETNYSLR